MKAYYASVCLFQANFKVHCETTSASTTIATTTSITKIIKTTLTTKTTIAPTTIIVTIIETVKTQNLLSKANSEPGS